MKKLLLVLLLVVISGCAELARVNIKWQDERASLIDGRVHVGMRGEDFISIWGYPLSGDRTYSRSAYAITEWLWYDNDDMSISSCKRYGFCFTNDILTYWTERER